MRKVQHRIAEEGVVQDTLQELMLRVANIVGEFNEATNPVPLVNYSRDELVKVDDGSGERAAGDD